MKDQTIIHGTLRTEDLLPAFLSALDGAIESATFNLLADSPTNVRYLSAVQDQLGDLERRMTLPGYYESEGAEWDMEMVQDLLMEFSPEGTCFGAHEGDGSDFGFWTIDDD